MEISFYKSFKLPFYKPYIKGKIICQLHTKKSQVCIIHPGYQIHINIGEGRNTYISSKGYKHFFLVVCEVINITFSKFIKKKSETLPVFIDLVTLLERQYNINI